MMTRVLRLALAVIVAALGLVLWSSELGQRIDPKATDLWFNVRGPIQPPGDVVLVAMDEMSYRELNLPFDKAWPRRLHAKLLHRLHQAGARRVVFDVLFLGAGSDGAEDRELAAALKLLPTVIGADFGWREHGSGTGTFRVEELITPHEPFRRAAEQLALVAMPEDDGFLRRFNTYRSQLAPDVQTLAEAGAGISPSAPRPRDGDMIWYYGPAGTVPTYSYYQVLERERPLPAELFRDKIVFVGLNLRTEVGPAQKDSYRTPFVERGRVFGVEIQATAALNLIHGFWLRKTPPAFAWGGVFAITLLVSLAVVMLRPHWGGLALVSALVGWGVVSFVCFLNGLALPGTVVVAVFLPAVYLVSTVVFYFITHRRQRETERAFQLYLSPEMARVMRDNPRALTLGGETVHGTALFTDIAGFTEITETMIAPQVSEMLNAYFSEVMESIFVTEGTLVKFIGDAVFALWGAPIKVGDHARRAVQSALEIQRNVTKFNNSKRFPALHTRIGIHTGPMVVGNLGSAKRFDYTAIGDTVNLASRLEGINRHLGTSILISEATRRELGGDYTTLPMGLVRVAGKRDVVAVFALFSDVIPGAVAERWGEALNHFRRRRWEEADAIFGECLDDKNLSVAAARYRTEIARYRVSPPPEEWAGEVVFDSK